MATLPNECSKKNNIIIECNSSKVSSDEGFSEGEEQTLMNFIDPSLSYQS